MKEETLFGKICKIVNFIFRWIKIINDKLLIFNNNTSSKAFSSYDVKECEIIGKVVEEVDVSNNQKRLSHCNLTGPLHGTSISSDNILNANNKYYENIDLVKQLNYIVEIDHPYLQKCLIKSKNLIDSMDFYNQILNIA